MYVDSPDDETYSAKSVGDGYLRKYYRATVEPLLATYRVDVAYFGHTHVLGRTCAALNGTCVMNATGMTDGSYLYANPNATVYWQLANSGAEDDCKGITGTTGWMAWSSPACARGYARVWANSTALRVDIMSALSLGTVMDSATITHSTSVPGGSADSGGTSIAPSAVAGAVLGSFFGVVLIVAAVFVWRRRRAPAALSTPQAYESEKVPLVISPRPRVKAMFGKRTPPVDVAHGSRAPFNIV